MPLRVPRPTNALDETRLALEIARAPRLLGEQDQAPVSQPEQDTRGVPAHRAMIEIAERQVESGMGRTRFHEGPIFGRG